MPAYLGSISVSVCFVAALMSLGLALLIIPRQVTPWSGLVLMYEWTFSLFFMFFGGYLHLIYRWGKITASQSASSVSHSGSSDYDSEKGMYS